MSGCQESGLPVGLTNGTGGFLTSALSAGTHSLTVRYTSDSLNFLDTASSPLSQAVAPRGLTVTADSRERTYGQSNPVLQGNLAGLQNNDPITASFSSAATVRSHVGTYAIVATLNDPNGKLSNYTLTLVGGTLTVTPAPLTITADDKSKVYWAPLPVLAATYTGFVNGDTTASLTALATLDTAATAHSPVGSYPITVTGGAGADYSLSYVAGTLAVVDCHGLNPVIPYDVSGEGDITPADALYIISYINAHPGNTSLPTASPPPFYNVSGDDGITPLDVLLVISYINSHPPGAAEAEASPTTSSSASGLTPTKPDTNAGLDASSRDPSLSPMTNPAMVSLVIPPAGTPKADVWTALATPEAQGSRRRDGQWGAGVPQNGAAFRRTMPTQTDQSTATDRRSAGLGRVLASEDGLWSPWDDVLQNLATDVDLAWQGT